MPQLTIGDLEIDVTYKDIKNVYLSVYPPSGRVRISAPLRMDLDMIRVFAISRLGWIRKRQAKFHGQERESPRDFINRESHYYLGKRYLLKVFEMESPPRVILNHSTIEMHLRLATDKNKREEILDEWYRERLKEIIPPIIQQWEKTLNVNVKAFGVKKMKTKWGSCNQKAGRVWINLELGKKPLQCLEYVIIHEMVHLLEKRHGERFNSYMDKFLPMWRACKEELNRFPLSHQDWSY